MKKKLLFLLMCFTMIFVVACSEEGDYYDGFLVKEEVVKENGDPVPAGGQYIKKATNATYTQGQNMPEEASIGDKYIYGDYVYTMKKNGWNVALNDTTDKTKTSFEDILESIAGTAIVDLNDLFKGCANMTASPKLPSTVQTMNNTFYECTALAEAPVLPASLEIMQSTFYGCTSLTEAPEIPSGVTNIKCAFQSCTSLVKASKLPSKLNAMSATFKDCKSLLEAPEIPASVTDLAETFRNCESMTKGSAIPENVKFFTDTYNGCISLTGSIDISTSTSYISGCFTKVNFAAQGLELTGSSTMLDQLLHTGIAQ